MLKSWLNTKNIEWRINRIRLASAVVITVKQGVTGQWRPAHTHALGSSSVSATSFRQDGSRY